MTITSELIQTIYTRAKEYATALYGRGEPDSIELEDDTIVARWVEYWGGEKSEEKEYISVEALSMELDEAVRQRRAKEEEERIKREAYEKEQSKLRKAKEERERRLLYLQLKKEFEGPLQ